MMSRKQYLLLKLNEECVEVAQRCSKQIQFGKNERQKNQDHTNSERLEGELLDLFVIVRMLRDCKEIRKPSKAQWLHALRNKRKKVEKYLKYSRKLGKVGR